MYGCGETALNLWYSIRHAGSVTVVFVKSPRAYEGSRYPPVNNFPPRDLPRFSGARC